jgi:SAM-dependent methyltransferase
MDINMVDNPDKSADDSAQWDRKWSADKYADKRRANFEIIDAYLDQPVGRLLDIGCGFAYESRWFNEKYGTELWLLDGDSSTNATKPETASYGNWNTDSSELKFYHTFDFLDTKLKELGTKNYHLVDANNINIPDDVKFDVITSWLSCGHHYPVATYIELMKKHSHASTRIVLDIRTKGAAQALIGVDGFEIVNKISNYGKKRCTAEIRLL